jgi:hypothetical protein
MVAKRDCTRFQREETSVKTTTQLSSYIGLFAAASALVQCREQAESRSVAEAPASSLPAQAPPTPSAAPVAPEADAGSGARAAGDEALALDAGLGGWIESAAYKFKVSGVAPCALPASLRSASNDGSAESVPEDRPLRIGVTVHVAAKFDEFFAAGRDVTIEKDGVIIRPEVNPKPSAGCTPLLEPRTLRHDQVAGGVVVFQVPDEAFVRSGIIAYEPTRWGGAPRVQLRVADLKLKPFKAAATAKPGK